MPEAAQVLKILLQVQADVAELQGKLNPALDETKRKLNEAGNAGADLNGVLAGLVGGLVAGGIGVIANALASIPAALQELKEEWRRVNEHVRTASDDLNEQIHIWDVLAQNATKFSDVVSLAGSGIAELTRLSKELEKAQSRDIGLAEAMFNKLSQMVNLAAGIDISTSPKKTEVKGLQDNLGKGLGEYNDKVDKAQAATNKLMDDLSRPPTDAFKDINDELIKAEDKLGTIDRRTLEGSKAYEDQLKTVGRLRGELEKVSQSVEKSVDQTDKFSLKQRQARIDAARLNGEVVDAAQHKLSVEEKVVELTRSNAVALKDGRITQAQINALAESQVSNAEKTKTATAGTREAASWLREQHQGIVVSLREQVTQLRTIQNAIGAINDEPFLFADQKAAQTAQLTAQAIKQLQSSITTNKAALAGGLLDPATYEQVRAKIVQDSAALVRFGQAAKTLGFGGKLRADLTAWVNQFGDTTKQVSNLITSTLTTAVNGVSNAITGAIFKTQSWGQAFAQIAQSIVANIIQIALQWAVSRALMAVLNIAFGETETGASTANATAQAAAWAPAAIAAATVSYGAAAGAGNTAFIAALLSGTAFATALSASGGGGGFESGGYTGGQEGRRAGFVHGEEFVFSAPAVRQAGVANLEAQHAALSRSGYASGGFVGRSSGASGKRDRGGETHIFNFIDMRQLQKAVEKSSATKKLIVNVVQAAGGRLRV